MLDCVWHRFGDGHPLVRCLASGWRKQRRDQHQAFYLAVVLETNRAFEIA